MLKIFSSTKSGKRTSKRVCTKAAVQAAYTKMWNSKIDVPFISEAKKLELEILEPCPHHTTINIS
jgi:hypothetical protein